MTVAELPLVLEAQPEGGFVVTCPLLPELVTEGESVREAMDNANDALEALLEAFQALGRPIPTECRRCLVGLVLGALLRLGLP